MRKVLASNEEGLTLVEVLAAMVILGIVFTGFMTIFPQMTNFNEKTEVKLETMNNIREELAVIQNNGKWRSDDTTDSVTDINGDSVLQTDEYIQYFMTKAGYTRVASQPSTEFIRYEKSGDYRFEADVTIGCKLMLGETVCRESDPIHLHKVHLKAFRDSFLSSETYGYTSIISKD